MDDLKMTIAVDATRLKWRWKVDSQAVILGQVFNLCMNLNPGDP
jgi:hypothetical protein